MDRVEFGIKLEQIEKLRDNNKYAEAAKVADTVDWRKVKRWSELVVAEEVYEKAGRFKDARNICVYAYNRNIGGKRLVYKLTELSIEIRDFAEADDLYREFVELAPNDMERYVLLYKLNKAKDASVDRLIEILEEYKQGELDEQYEYELATLYAKADRIQDCIRECDDLILWFNEGDYVEKALRLKAKHTKLTKSQQSKLDAMAEYRAAGVEYGTVIPDYDKDSNEAAEVKTEPEQPEEDADVVMDEYQPPKPLYEVAEKDYSIYDTQNIQAALAKSMELIMSGINSAKEELPKAVDTHEITDGAPEPDNTNEAEPEVEEDTEDVVSDELNTEEVDEPTKEIRINTHHWKDYKSVMVEEEEKDIPLPEGTLPKYMVDKQEIEAETETDSDFKIVEIETVIEEDDDDTVITETEKETVDEISEENTDVTTTNTSEETEATPVEDIAETVQDAAKELIATSEDMTENVAEDVIEGQMDIMQWMTTNEAATAESEETEITEHEEAQPEDAQEASDTTQPEDTAEDKLVEDAMSELESQLMEAVNSDFDQQNVSEKPSSVLEEEFINSEETEESDTEDLDDPEDEGNDFILKASQKKYLKKYLFINGLEGNIAQILKAKSCEKYHTDSASGNIVITGNSKADRTGFAINLFKALHADDEQKDFRIAKTNASIINSRGILGSADKVRGTTLIVENAGQLTKEGAEQLRQLMAGNTDSMLVIITGENYAINRVFAENPALEQMFEHTIEIRKYTVNELVALSKEYAREKGYIITEKAMFRLFIILGKIQAGSSGNNMEKVREVVDNAIEHAGSRKKHAAKKGIPVPLKEKDFII